MKNRKFILGAVAFIVTASSALAFRATHKSGGSTIYGATNAARTNCVKSTCFTGGGSGAAVCHSQVGGAILRTNGSGAYWTATNAAHKCVNPTLAWTHSA